MNILLLGLVLYSYFVPSAPKVFKENKQLVLGIFIGVTIYQMNLVEGILDEGCNCNLNVGHQDCGAKIHTMPKALKGGTNSEGETWSVGMYQCESDEICDYHPLDCLGSGHYNGKCKKVAACSNR
tara:strand:- start:1652 stop:2026 length:375 start_codon:yes stop_codon:yes gene_type:complete